ncbi:glycosyltransferase [Bacillus sp. UMB0899]|nr:glycosyltransferase [Bacillus sp. UMB0899]
MVQNKRLTVFTPTFNRAHTLIRTYESLCSQTCKDFIWLIIDDGSTDNTKELVEKWIHINVIEIKYVYKNNGGMHTAHNLAYNLIETELNVCVDSDDIMPCEAIEKILNIWDNRDSNDYAGIIGLDANFTEEIIGTKAPIDLKASTLVDLYNKYKVTGDKKLVYRTDVMKEIKAYPEFKGEKLVPLGYKYLLIDLKYKMIVSNEIFCHVEYQVDGSSSTIIKQYFQSPRGFAEARKARMQYSPYFFDRFKSAIHYVSSSIIIKNRDFFKQSPRKMLTFFAFPFGYLLNIYLKIKVKKIQQ